MSTQEQSNLTFSTDVIQSFFITFQEDSPKLYVECNYATARCLYPKEVYPTEDIALPIKAPFADFHVRLPRNPEHYLTSYYGPNWRGIAETPSYCHQNQENVCPVSFSLSEEPSGKTLPPAQPFY